ncbi:MAG TPA: hypothetical protein VHA33_25495 [Candidatus Angelobacter sp.]|jgi:hypothetical protein|nr:hypothetical protein [Candidatus Angelobacter sp.]
MGSRDGDIQAGTKADLLVSNTATVKAKEKTPGKGREATVKRKLLLFVGVLFVMLALKYAFGH